MATTRYLRVFQDNSIESYFSGCLTLTLQPDKKIRKHDFILAVDIPDELFEFLSQRTERKIIRMSPYGDFYLPEEARFTIAEYFLYLYQSAHAIVTTRLHTALPSLALRTPVVLIKDDDNYDPVRYSGLDNLVRNATADEYMNDYNLFDLDDPGDNPARYLKIRQSLIEKCVKYTGYDNNKSFMAINPAELVDDENFIATFTNSFSKRLSSMINGWKVDELTYKNGELKKEIDKLRQLNNVLSNNLQKVQDDYTGLIYDYNTIKNTSVKYIVRTMSRKVGAKIRRHK